MTPVSPVIEGMQELEIVLAKSQPEYTPLSVLRLGEYIISRWRFTDEERRQISLGADVILQILGSSHPPVGLQVAMPDAYLEDEP